MEKKKSEAKKLQEQLFSKRKMPFWSLKKLKSRNVINFPRAIRTS